MDISARATRMALGAALLGPLLGALECIPAQAAEPAPQRLAIAGVPPLAWGASLDLAAGPVRLRADGTASSGITGGALGIEAPMFQVGPLTAGPLVAAYLMMMPPRGRPMSSEPLPLFGPGEAGLAYGIALRWHAGPWWLHLSPAIAIKPEPPVPVALGVGQEPPPQPSRLGWFQGLVAGPPAIELGYQITDRLDLVVRSSLAPLAVAWRF